MENQIRDALGRDSLPDMRAPAGKIASIVAGIAPAPGNPVSRIEIDADTTAAGHFQSPGDLDEQRRGRSLQEQEDARTRRTLPGSHHSGTSVARPA